MTSNIPVRSKLLAGCVALCVSACGVERVASDQLVDASPEPNACPQATTSLFPIGVSKDGRSLATASGQPFLLNGDTAWSLMVQLTREETEAYLENRRQKGFNAILVNLIESKNADAPPKNAYGAAPFTKAGDFSTPNETYFAHADWVIKKAAEKGILVVLNPAYTGFSGNGTTAVDGWLRTIIANNETKGRNDAYGRYIANRYKEFPNILWQAVGDSTLPAGGPGELAWLEILRGIRSVLPDSVWSAHYQRFSSARDRAAFTPYMTIDNAYGGNRSYVHTLRAYNRTPVRPTFYNEGYYEGDQVERYAPQQQRAQAYWALLSGATGHIFGSHHVWSFGFPFDGSAKNWRTGIDRQGSREMTHVKALFEGRAWHDLIPDQDHTVVTAGYGTFGTDDRTPGGNYVTAARTSDGNLVMAYVSSTGTQPRTVTVNLGKLAESATARWYNPTNGTFTSIDGSPFSNSGLQRFTTPGNNGTGTNDWVLVLEVSPPPPVPAPPPTSESPEDGCELPSQ